MSMRASILVLILATCSACNSISCPPKSEEPEQNKTQEVAGVPSFLLDSSKYDSIEADEDDRYSCVGALVGPGANIIGSAVLIHPRAILTAHHCFDDPNYYPNYFWTKNGQLIKIKKVILAEPYSITAQLNDIALCILEEDCFEPPTNLIRYPFELARGEPLITVGWSLGFKKISRSGVMHYYGSLIEDHGQVMRMLATKGSIYFGDSGGAVFEDGGKLAGIIDFMSMDHETNQIIDNGAARIDYFYDWIDSSMKEEVCDWPWFSE
jgi:hypothetical protein